MSFSFRANGARPRRLAAALLLPSLLAAGTVSAADAWVATQSRAIVPVAGTATTPVSPSLPLHVMVSLEYRNRDGLKTFLGEQGRPGSPSYGVALSQEQFAAEYAPTAGSVAAVKSYLAAMGFSHIAVTASNKVVSADGTAALAEKAFNTQLAQYLKDGKTVHSPLTAPQVPAALGGIVQSVLGLQNAVMMHTHQASGDPTTAQIVPAFTALAIRQAYDAVTAPTGQGTTVAIGTSGDDLSIVRADLLQAQRVAHLPYTPTDVVVTAPLPSPQDTSGDGEWDLDSQSSTGIAGAVKHLIFYAATDLGDSQLMNYDAFASDTESKALNLSYGGCEFVSAVGGDGIVPTTGLEPDDDAFMKANAVGKTVFVSAGDAGAACGAAVNLVDPDTGVPSQVEYPSSSPYVVAVGGTSMYTDSSHNYVMETAWAAGGGGVSNFETAPKWQAPAGVTTANTGMRSTPDIAMVAGLDVNAEAAAPVFASAYYTYSGGLLYRSVGTSLSSPLSMGVWARMESARCNGLSFAAPLIYALDTTGGTGSTANGFTDITTGTNGEYVATVGWDNTTGFGSWDIDAANGALPKMSCAANQAPVAVLNADTVGGAAPLKVTVDASASTDPDGDALSYYVMDYDDDTPVVIQTSPSFAPHSYAQPGYYTASLSVRDARGGISSTVTQLITVTGVPPTCTVPGIQVVTSPAGATGVEGQDPYSGADDLLSTSLSEPADKPGELVFTMKVNNLNSLPSGLHWITYFTNSNDLYFDTFYFVEMSTADGTAPVYNYGTRSFTPGNGYRVLNVIGDLNAASTETADGSITLVLDKSALKLNTGDRLENLTSYVALGGADEVAGEGAPAPATQNLDLGGGYYGYHLIGNDVCKGITYTPGASTTGGTSGGSTGGTSTGGTSGGTSTGSSSGGGTSTGGTSGGSTGGTSTGGTSGSTSTGGSGGGTSTDGTTGGTSTGGTSGGSTGGTSTGGTSGGTSTGGSNGGGTSTGGTTGGTSTGGTSGGSTGGTSTGGTSGGTSTGGSSGGTSTASTSGGTTTTGSAGTLPASTTATGESRLGGAASPVMLLAFAVLARRRRRRG